MIKYNMIILGLDQSFTCSGIVVIQNGTLIYCDKYVSDKTLNIYERAWQIVSYIKQIAIKYNPDYIAIEGLAYCSKGNATRDLAGLQFAIISNLCYNTKIPFKIVPPTAVKKQATGKGNGDKMALVTALPPEVRQMFDNIGAKKTTGLQDLTDAFWIAITAAHNENICTILNHDIHLPD